MLARGVPRSDARGDVLVDAEKPADAVGVDELDLLPRVSGPFLERRRREVDGDRPGWEQGASMSLQRVILAMKCVKDRLTLRELNER